MNLNNNVFVLFFRQSGGYPSLDSTLVKTDKSECSKEQKDWNVLGGSFVASDKPAKR